jgi:cytochrome P450
MIKLAQGEGGFPFVAYTRKLVDNRIEQGTSRPEFMSRMLEHKREDGIGITRDEVDATMAILVLAGSETTATLLSGCVYLLLRNPDKLKKLREEILAEFSSADEISIARTSHMSYVFAVLEESLRVYPPVPISLPRIVPSQWTSVRGHWIPGGVSYFKASFLS